MSDPTVTTEAPTATDPNITSAGQSVQAAPQTMGDASLPGNPITGTVQAPPPVADAKEAIADPLSAGQAIPNALAPQVGEIPTIESPHTPDPGTVAPVTSRSAEYVIKELSLIQLLAVHFGISDIHEGQVDIIHDEANAAWKLVHNIVK